jgi:3-hydroxyacyl-CoA dehydrogenase
MKIMRKTAVLGAGTMGAQIAAHLANAGFPVLLLDVSRELADRGRRGLESASPAPLFVPERIRLIETGTFDHDLGRLAECDWTVEAVVEDAAVKRGLLERVDAARKPGSLITTNTSGLSISGLAGGRSDDFRRHWFGTHFFNPPRYMRLLELIPTADTDARVLAEFEQFASIMLGKGVVHAKDTPNFIANRVGLYAALRAIHLMDEFGLAIEEIDRLTGTLIGRPKTATFRTIDLVGLDIFKHVANNIYDNAPHDPERETFRLPPFIDRMVERKMLGAKTGGGFYRKQGEEILVIDPDTLEYRTQRKVSFPAIEMVSNSENLEERLAALFQVGDRSAEFVKRLLVSTFEYAAARAPEIADSPAAIDCAMRWGFAWEQGPFELWSALRTAPAAITESLRSDAASRGAGWIVLRQQPVIKSNAGATLRDLGDGVACLEFHSKMNTIGGDIIAMLHSALEEVNANFDGLVIGNQGAHFSAGANIMLVLMEAVEGNWDEIDHMVRTFQRATRAIKYNPRPVVAAPFNLALGGGCEFAISAARIQAAAETYIGLVEVGAGLIPAGGGTTEMLARGHDRLRDVFQNIGLGKVSASAEDARRLLYLRPSDSITMNSDRLIQDAKHAVMEMAAAGYRPPVPAELPVLGEPAAAELKLGIHLMHKGGHITEYEASIARKLVFVLCGGDVTRPATAPEQYFLDLEREAFVSLCGHPNTLARMEHLLKKGKVLRN